MAVRKDSIQISVDIETSKGVQNYQKLLDETKKVNNEMRRLKRQGKESSEEFKNLEKRSKELQKSFSKFDVATAKWGQLQKRARELDRDLKYKLIPGTKEFVQATEEFQKVNARLKEIKGEVNGVKKGMDETRIAGIKVPQGIIKAFVAVQFLQYFVQLFNILDDTTKQFVKLRGEIERTTGAGGDELDNYTSKIAAISKTFNKENEEVLKAANSLTKQLTGDFNESLQLIEKGFLAGADRSGDFLNQIKEYPSFFREAGLTGADFISVISQSVDEGVFSDKGVDLLKEFTIRVREMPKATQEAFQAIGTNSEEISKEIDERGIGGAFTLIQGKLQNLKEDSPEVGQALADIFGGPGEDAGIQFIKQLNLTEDAVNDLIIKGGEYTEAIQDQLAAEEDLAEAQNRVAKGFQDTSNSLSVYITQIKSFLFNIAGDVLEFFEELPATGAGVKAALQQIGENFVTFFKQLALDAQIQFAKLKKLNPFNSEQTKKDLDAQIDLLLKQQGELIKAGKSAGEAYREAYLAGLEEVKIRKKVAEAINPKVEPNDVETNANENAKTVLDAQEKAFQEELAKRKASAKPVATIASGAAPGQVTSTGEAVTDTSAQDEILKNKFLKQLITEQEYEDQRFELQQVAYDRRLDYLREKFGEESAQFIALENQKLEAQKDYEEQRAELTKRTEEFRTQIQEQGLSAFGDLVGATIELLKGEEGERKKNSLALKAFSAGKVVIDTEEAIMAIIKNAQANPANILFPGAGNLIAGVKIAAVTAKSIAALNKIRNQGFYEGGPTGNTPLFKDNRGRDIVGAVHKNEWVAPSWQVQHPVYGQMIGWLETMRKRGFQEGGFGDQPSFAVPGAGTTSLSGTSNNTFEKAVRDMIRAQMETADAIKRKQFSVPSGQVADALDEEYRLRKKNGF
jgi:flavin-binding protein dodecin